MGLKAFNDYPARQNCRRLSITCAAIALVAASAHAEDIAGQNGEQAGSGRNDATVLETITVVSRTGETVTGTMASVSQIEGEQLRLRMAATPQELLSGVPGVTVQSDARRGASSLNIRGLQDFGRVAVIVDGARQNFQRTGHGAQSLLFIDPALVKQVDVIRGPVANTYGSGAISGVVFFETKDAADFLENGETWAVSTTGMFDSNAGGWTTSAAAAYRFNDWADVLGNLVWRDYGDYESGDGSRVAGTAFDVVSGLVKTTIRTSDNSELKLGWSGISESWAEKKGLTDYDLDQDSFTARYNITDDDRSWLDLHVNASYNQTGLGEIANTASSRFDSQTGRRVSFPAGARSSWDIGTYGVDIWNTSRFETASFTHELTYGGDGVFDRVKTLSPEGGSDVYTPSGKRRVWGGYIQDKIRYEWLELVGAVRYDGYELRGNSTENSGSRISPRLSVGVSPFKSLPGLQFYGTYGEGYRSPSLSETLVSGLHPQGVAFPFLPNPDLKPETGKTWEGGVNFRHNGLFRADDTLRVKAAWFHNDVDDYIGLNDEISPGTDGCRFLPGLPIIGSPGGYYIPACAQYQNFAKARIKGFEFEAFYDSGRVFGGISASFIDGHTISHDGDRDDLNTIPSSQVTGQLGLRMMDNALILGGEVQYNTPPKGASFADDYTLVNLFASYHPSKNVRLDFRADNLFDVKYANPLNATTTSIVYEQGLTLKLGATVRFGG